MECFRGMGTAVDMRNPLAFETTLQEFRAEGPRNVIILKHLFVYRFGIGLIRVTYISG